MAAPAAGGQGPAPRSARTTRRPREVPGTAAAGTPTADAPPAAPAPTPAPEPFPADTRRAADQGAGVILGMLLWGWIVLPLLKGGPREVRNVIRAKFLNKAADGSWLP